MSNAFSQASFVCEHCDETIYIPAGLPPTTSPCPHCGMTVTSPVLEAPRPEPLQKLEPPKREVASKPSLPKVTAEELVVEQSKPLITKTEDIVVPDVGASEQKVPKIKKGVSWIIPAAILILLVVGGGVFFLVNKQKGDALPEPNFVQTNTITEPDPTPETEPVTKAEPQPDPELPDDDWVNIGWKRDAEEVLGVFLASRSPEEKMDYVIPNAGALEDLQTYFPEGVDEDVRLSGFLFSEGNREDRERGIFLMHYNLPPKVSDGEYFTAIENDPADKEEVNSLLEMAYSVDVNEPEQPVLIHAYFKKTEEGLKLDSSVFIQGKYRTFSAFKGHPQVGKTKVFRVVISEVVRHEIHDHPSLRAYKISDACYPQDYVIIEVEKDSEVGEVLSVLNWRGTNKRALPKAATVELEWSDSSSPEITLKKVLCWEFLGVGGKLENTDSETAN